MSANLVGAITALVQGMAAQQQQQHHFVQTQDEQNDLLRQLLAHGGPIQPAPAPQPAAAVLTPRMGKDVYFDGSSEESFESWFEEVERAAQLHGWDDAQKRRAAISTLRGAASNWNGQLGAVIPEWNDWLAGLQNAFVPIMTETQWQIRMRDQVQGPTESGVHYALAKMRLVRRRPTATAEWDAVTFLVKGLRQQEHRLVMMTNPPASFAAFIAEIQRLERFTDETWPHDGPIGLKVFQQPVAPTMQNDPVMSTLENLVEKMENVAKLLATIPALPGPVTARPPLGYVGGHPRPSYGAGQRPSVTFGQPGPNQRTDEFRTARRPISDAQCFSCQQFGHYARDCPHGMRPSSPSFAQYVTDPDFEHQQSENDPAGH